MGKRIISGGSQGLYPVTGDAESNNVGKCCQPGRVGRDLMWGLVIAFAVIAIIGGIFLIVFFTMKEPETMDDRIVFNETLSTSSLFGSDGLHVDIQNGLDHGKGIQPADNIDVDVTIHDDSNRYYPAHAETPFLLEDHEVQVGGKSVYPVYNGEEMMASSPKPLDTIPAISPSQVGDGFANPNSEGQVLPQSVVFPVGEEKEELDAEVVMPQGTTDGIHLEKFTASTKSIIQPAWPSPARDVHSVSLNNSQDEKEKKQEPATELMQDTFFSTFGVMDSESHSTPVILDVEAALNHTHEDNQDRPVSKLPVEHRVLGDEHDIVVSHPSLGNMNETVHLHPKEPQQDQQPEVTGLEEDKVEDKLPLLPHMVFGIDEAVEDEDDMLPSSLDVIHDLADNISKESKLATESMGDANMFQNVSHVAASEESTDRDEIVEEDSFFDIIVRGSQGGGSTFEIAQSRPSTDEVVTSPTHPLFIVKDTKPTSENNSTGIPTFSDLSKNFSMHLDDSDWQPLAMNFSSSGEDNPEVSSTVEMIRAEITRSQIMITSTPQAQLPEEEENEEPSLVNGVHFSGSEETPNEDERDLVPDISSHEVFDMSTAARQNDTVLNNQANVNPMKEPEHRESITGVADAKPIFNLTTLVQITTASPKMTKPMIVVTEESELEAAHSTESEADSDMDLETLSIMRDMGLASVVPGLFTTAKDKTSGDKSRAFVGHENRKLTTSFVPLDNRQTPGVCEQRKLPFCEGVLPYTETRLPNWVGDSSDVERNLSIPYFEIIANYECHPRVKQYMCSVLEPSCSGGVNLPPCRKFCKAVSGDCQEYVLTALPLAQVFECEQFPDSDDPEICVNLARAKDGQCLQGEFRCADHTCIPKAWVCDGSNDCSTGNDETSCSSCTEQEFRCENENRCIPRSWRCDGGADCIDGSDERDCLSPERCSEGQFRCRDGLSCIPRRWVCDGSSHCRDNSDEVNCTSVACEGEDFKCKHSGLCISKTWRCDGNQDCSDGSDEQDCILREERLAALGPAAFRAQQLPSPENTFQEPDVCGQDELICSDGTCVRLDQICDSTRDCSDGADELNCTAPAVSQEDQEESDEEQEDDERR